MHLARGSWHATSNYWVSLGLANVDALILHLDVVDRLHQLQDRRLDNIKLRLCESVHFYLRQHYRVILLQVFEEDACRFLWQWLLNISFFVGEVCVDLDCRGEVLGLFLLW